MRRYITILLFGLSAVGCDTFGLYNSDSSTVVASVGEVELRSSDLEDIYNQQMSQKDSLDAREAYISSWIRAEIKRQEAEKVLSGSKVQDLERMVSDYRTELLNYKYENEYIENHLDTVVTDEQISQYYQANKENFRLAGPLVKARVVKIPSGLRQSNKLEDMFRGDKESLMEDFVNICQKNNYRLDDYTGQWTDFSVVLQHIPFTQKNFDEFLKKTTFYEVSDDEWKYMMKIEDYMLPGSISPIEREKDIIAKILKNMRRSELLRNLDDSLYKAAQMNKLITQETSNKK